MSWSIFVLGKPKAVIAEVDRQISNTHVNLEPELEIQKAIAEREAKIAEREKLLEW